MTTDKLEKLNCLARKIKSLKEDLETLNYIGDKDKDKDVSLSAKDGRKLYEASCSVRIPRSLRSLICQEVQNELEIELKRAEKEFEQEG